MKKTLLFVALAAFSATMSLAQITVPGPINFNNVSGGSLSPVFQGSAGTAELEPGVLVPKITGTLNSVDIDAILTATVNGVYANDLMVFVSSSEDLTVATNYLLQIGGFSNFTANKFAWGCGAACDTDVIGTAVGGEVNTFAGLDFTNTTLIIWIGNGYIDANPPTTEGSWTINSIEFGGVTLAPASVEENTMEVSMFPNPANDVLNVSVKGEMASVNVISLDGKVVIAETVSGTTAALNVADLMAGSYVLEVVGANGSVSRSNFIKK